MSRGLAKASACRLQITLSGAAKVNGILSVKMVGGVKLTVIYGNTLMAYFWFTSHIH